MGTVKAGASTRGARTGLIGLAVAIIVLVGTVWFLRHYQRVTRVEALPPQGEVLWNPVYILRQSLHADGVKAESRPQLDLEAARLGKRDTLVLLNDPRNLDAAHAQALMDWVAQGGHLVMRTPVSEGFGVKEWMPLMDRLHLQVESEGGECVRLQLPGQPRHAEFCNDRRFSFDDGIEPELAWGDVQSGFVYARLAHGQGRVDVIAGTDFLENGNWDPRRGWTGGMHDAAHQWLVRQILAPNYGQGTVHLVYAVQMPSLWRTLLVAGWPAWLPLLLALLAWLWARAQRLGPPLPAPEAGRRSLLEHVRASGEFLLRQGKGAWLYDAVRQAFLARLRRRDPLTAALHGQDQAQAIATRLQVPVARVQQALQQPPVHARAAFAERISLLIWMRNRL